jgi:ABC-type nitrate/sulfonate/bicarbonate transport system substrate-binding protein
MVKNNQTALLIALLVIGMSVFGMLFFYRLNREQITETITIAVADQPVFALIFIADTQGFFKQQGLEVIFRRHTLGRDAIKDVIEGRADIATAYDVPVVHQINQGHNLGILTSLHSSDQNHTIVALSSSGISTAQDFSGKKIAMTRGTSSEFYLYSYLMEQGIALSEVIIVNLEFQQRVAALENGIVDAAVVVEPYALSLQKKYPPPQIRFFYSETYSEASVLVGKKDFIQNNETKIIKTLQALYQAEQFILKNREESIQQVQKSLPDYSIEDLSAIWNIFTFYLKLDNKLFATMSREAKFFEDTGIYTNQTPRLRLHFFDDYLQKLYPERVTLY